MKTLMNTKKIALLLFVSLLGMSCSKSEDAPIPVEPAKSITALAATNPDLTTLVAALKRTGLDLELAKTEKTYTVFAPTNAAFASKLGTDGIAGKTDAQLKEILLNHVLVVKKTAADLKTGYESTILPSGIVGGTTLSLFVDKTTGVKLNGVSKVTSPDLMASNGVIHIVDAVIPTLTIVGQAKINTAFSKLVTSLTTANLVATLDLATSNNPLTVLAPTDDAFKIAFAGWALNATTPVLTKVLQYHVIAGNAQSTSPVFVNDAPLKTYGGQNISVVKLPGTTSLKFKDFATDNSTVLIADVQCSNGIIHAVDKVLQPDLSNK
jgi:uncharacterized surface protein with fasciclin (FAS1) repeats